MSIDAIGFLPPLNALPPENGTDAVRSGAGGFEGWMRTALGETNQLLIDADQQVTRLAMGETDNLHQVMMALDKAKVSFQLMVQVRNKLLEAYQDVLRMQI